MKQAFIPFVLLSIGFVVIVLAVMTMPLFEWEIIENSISSWRWKAKLGESFDDGSYLIRKNLYTQDKRNCLQENYIINRSLQDEELEQLSLTLNKIIPWLYGLNLIGIFLSGAYILWYTKQREKLPTSSIIIFPILIFWCLTNVLIYSLKVSPLVYSHNYFGKVNCYPETITLNAELTGIYFAMPIVLLIGISLGFGAFVIMIKEMLRQAINDEEPPKLLED